MSDCTKCILCVFSSCINLWPFGGRQGGNRKTERASHVFSLIKKVARISLNVSQDRITMIVLEMTSTYDLSCESAKLILTGSHTFAPLYHHNLIIMIICFLFRHFAFYRFIRARHQCVVHRRSCLRRHHRSRSSVRLHTVCDIAHNCDAMNR